MDAKTVLEKLRDDTGGVTTKLAELVVNDGLGRTLAEIIDVPFTAKALRDGVLAFTASDAAAAKIVALLTEGEKLVAAEKRTLGARISPSIRAGAHELATLEVTLPREVVEKLLDREPIKKLLRAQVVETLVAFGRRAASPVADNPIARGIGGLGKLALGASGKSGKPSAFGALANAVSGEVEKQVEKRAADFADTAVAGIIEGIAAQMSDPARAKDQAAMRLAFLDGVLDLTGAEVAQITRGPIAQRVAVLRKALAAWGAEARFEADVEELVTTALAGELARPFGDVLADLGIRDAVAATARAHVRTRILAFVKDEPFGEWLGEVLA